MKKEFFLFGIIFFSFFILLSDMARAQVAACQEGYNFGTCLCDNVQITNKYCCYNGTSWRNQDNICQEYLLWSEDFSGYDRDWLCHLNDCSVTPGMPRHTDGTISWINTGGFAGNADCASLISDWYSGISTLAARVPGVNNRGFRIKLCQENFPNNENVLRSKTFTGTGSNPTYIRWYMRESTANFNTTVYQKLFRIKDQSGYQKWIPEWKGYSSYTSMIISVSPFNDAKLEWTNYKHNSAYTPNTWSMYEIKIDAANNKYEFWVNGVSMGEKSAVGDVADPSWRVRAMEIGGNQDNNYSGPLWQPTTAIQTRDYSDVVVSSKPIGPIVGVTIPPINTAPSAPIGVKVI